MNSVADLVIALTDLLEAEGRAFRKNAVRLGWALVLVWLAAMLLLLALLFWLWSAYSLALLYFPPHGAAAIVGGGLLLLTGVIAWSVHRLIR